MRTTTRVGLAILALLLPALACAHPYRTVIHLPYGVQLDLLDPSGEALPTAERSGRRYVLGEHGERYTIRVTNPSSRRVEVVVSVDGLDVIDGKPASMAKRGYVINPYGEVRIEGWRTSVHGVAAFRFGRVADSYAGRTVGARNVGVIGVALFTERPAPPPPPQPIMPIPRRHGWYDEQGDRGGAGGAPSAPKASAAPAPAARGAAKSAAGADAELAPSYRRRAEERPGLGTEFGEHRTSVVSFTSFVRDNFARPTAYAELRYNDHGGLARLGIHFGEYPDEDDTLMRETAHPFPGTRAFAAPPPPRY